MRTILTATIAFVLIVSHACGRSPQPYQISTDSIFKHVSVLASDSLEGREIGETGAWKAAQYVQGIFKSAGLVPKGDSGGYLQAFEFTKRISLGPNNRLTVNGQPLQLSEEFIPMSYSASTTFDFKEVVSVDYGIKTEDSSYNDYSGKNVEGKAVLIKRFAPPVDSNSRIDFNKYNSVSDKIMTAVAQRASGIFFVTPADQDDTIQTVSSVHVTPKDIPVIFLRRKALERLGISLESPIITSAAGQAELIPVKDTGYNVLGLLPGQSDTTIVLGAHYDHLGWGGPTSRYLGKEKMIHYGADDNGSGSAGMLELVRYFSSRRNQLHHSILFASFTGEEEGILGSSHFVESGVMEPGKIRMMLNLDMIGRLKDQENGLAIFGTGTASDFKGYFDSLRVDSLKLTFREPGTGPSDHTAFYNSHIPVLHFFTGAHDDYHKPSDTPDKIDLVGLMRVVQLVADIAEHFDAYPRPLTFQKTKDPDAGKQRAQFSVTLGIMPDFISQVKGLRVDGVSLDRPAERAGILKGDVVLKMGDIAIDDIYAYMAALSKFRKGDSTSVLILRGADTLKLPVVFK